MEKLPFIRFFNEIGIADIAQTGGKNASLGEMFRQLSPRGIRVPDGFAVTAAAYWRFIDFNGLRQPLTELFENLDRGEFSNLNETSERARNLMLTAKMPPDLAAVFRVSFKSLSAGDENASFAVRSSATAEDLPTASFAGQHESYLNVSGEAGVLAAVQKCFASLFLPRAIKYREDNGFGQMQVALSVGVQRMVRSDLASAGIAFTIEPDSGFRDIILISGVWGLGENIVQGAVTPDEFYVFKPTLRSGHDPIVMKKLGEKAKMMVYADATLDPTPDPLKGGNIPERHDNQSFAKENNSQASAQTAPPLGGWGGEQQGVSGTLSNIETPTEKRRQFTLSDAEIKILANWCLQIEEHYAKPMDIEWAKDGLTGELFIVQARPETVVSRRNPFLMTEFSMTEQGRVLAKGQAVGSRIATGIARVLSSPEESDKLLPGEILVTDITSPDWDPILKKAGAIVTNKGGRTSHASIVARELGVVAVVGTGNATENIRSGQAVTVSCAESEVGKIYDGTLHWTERQTDLSGIRVPKTAPMLIVADPDKAYKLSFYPNRGVGLMRLEFVVGNSIRVHPMALAHFDSVENQEVRAEIEKLTAGFSDKKSFFIERLAQAVATIACAFYPKDVIVRMSDFKSNEYANLIGGHQFEPREENPMLGFRGASRYYSDAYRDGFLLECAAMKKVREEMGLTNVKLMIPFCRTVEEGEKVVNLMAENGLKRRQDEPWVASELEHWEEDGGRQTPEPDPSENLEIYVMVEIPSNVLLAEDFAKIFDGFSIGSNDLTQLTLGVDRDSELIRPLFDENNPAVKTLIRTAIEKANAAGIKIGLCGQAPSDYPAFARFLVECGIGSISFNPDALLRGIENINAAELMNE